MTPTLLELHASLREAGLLVGVQRLRSVQSATSVRTRDGQTEITDGPFAVTKEVLAGYYILDCADLDEALKQAARLPVASWGTVEVRPVVSADDRVPADSSDVNRRREIFRRLPRGRSAKSRLAPPRLAPWCPSALGAPQGERPRDGSGALRGDP